MSSLFNPSYAQGFATREQSNAPGLWKGVQGLWTSSLGPTGLTLRDQSGFGNHGQLQNMDPATDYVPSGNPRLPGYVLELLYANSQTIELSPRPSFSATDHYTATWWMRTDGAAAGSNNGIYRSGAPSHGVYGWWVARSTGKLWGRHNGSDVVTGNTGIPVTDGLWHQIAVTWDGVDVRLYDDGIEFGSLGIVTGSAWDVYRFGRQSVSEYYTGQLGLFVFYNRALLSSEIQHLYDRPLDMLTPRSRGYPATAAAPPAGLSIPIAMHHYQQMAGVN